MMMRRREFIGVLGGAAAWPVVARAQQQATKVYHVAWISPAAPVTELTESSSIQPYRAFLIELRRLGYVEGQNLIVDRYSGEGRPERYADLARDVVTRQPDLVFTIGNAISRRLQLASATIPIVALVADPIATGLSTSLARPSGNVTGVSIDAGIEIWGKRLALLKETVLRLSSAGFLSSKRIWDDEMQMTPLRDAAKQLGISLVGCTLERALQESEYRRVFEAIPQDRLDALVVSTDPENFTNRKLIVDLVANAKLPAIYPFPEYIGAGGLISYGADVADMYRQAARQIDEVLKGAKPSDIPFYQQTKFELVINLRTAKALGLTISPSLLARADEVIE
jgi:putative tryptophan/tyrosine transport system substrate-binding protein